MRIETIGDATLYLGDCLEILPTLAAGSVDAVVTDPPYGLNFPYLSYIDTRENLSSLIASSFCDMRRISARVFVLCGVTQINLYPPPDWISCVTWNTTGTFGKYGYSQWMPLLCYGDDVSGFGNVNGVTKSDTIRINGGGGVGVMRDDEKKHHPCPKPITVMRPIMTRFTENKSTILDPFMGSGTTGVAALRLRRKFIGIEIEPKYFDIACRRIEQENRQLKMF